MIRRLSSVVALVVLLVIADCSIARATRVIPRLTQCPVCGKSFIIMTIGSFNTFGAQARDLSSSPFARFTKAQTCPYCLYSALNSDFDEVTEAEKEAIRKLLANFRLQPCPEEAKALASAKEDSRLLDQDYLGFIMARQCNAVRKPDARREFNLSLLLFYHSNLDCEELHTFYRKRAIESLRRELGSKQFSKHQQAMFTYLLGELLRQDGQTDAAIREFTRAAEMAKPFLSPKPKDGEDSYQWIVDWAHEQSVRARFASEPTEKLRPLLAVRPDSKDAEAVLQKKIALATLADRTDREAWSILADFAMADPKNLDDLIHSTKLSEDRLRIDPRLWEHLQRQFVVTGKEMIKPDKSDADSEALYQRWKAIGWILMGGDYLFSGTAENAAVLKKVLPEYNRTSMFVEVKGRPKETVEDVAHRLAGADPWASEPERLVELNPHFQQKTDIVGSKSLRVVRTPPMWTETRLMANLPRLIRSGDRQAVDFFFRWCHTVGPNSLERFKYYITDCFIALAADTSLWSVPADLQTSNVAEQRFLASCLRYLHGDDAVRQELLAHLFGKSESEASLAADCFSIRRDLAVKEPILKHWEAGKQYEWYAGFMVRKYLSQIATPTDLPRIESIAALKNVNRHDVEEDILIRLRLRELLRRLLSEKATTAPQ